MTVVKIKDRTTKSHANFDTYSHSSNSFIYTDATEAHIEDFSLEVSVGEGWSDNYSANEKSLWRIDEGITIKRHDSIVVEAAEEIRVPHNRYGLVLPTGSLFLSRGVLVASAKVEPAFLGRLKLRIFNTTNKSVRLRKGEKLGSVIFFSTESTHTHEIINRASEISIRPITIPAKFKKWSSLNMNTLISWILASATGSLATFVVTYFLYYQPMLEFQKNKASHSEQVQPPASENKPK
ncbi:dCTP deaminase domain-containing protein [Pseudomonas serbica]|jgi:deoxycytidine triphosphate deaminase